MAVVKRIAMNDSDAILFDGRLFVGAQDGNIQVFEWESACSTENVHVSVPMNHRTVTIGAEVL